MAKDKDVDKELARRLHTVIKAKVPLEFARQYFADAEKETNGSFYFLMRDDRAFRKSLQPKLDKIIQRLDVIDVLVKKVLELEQKLNGADKSE